MSLDSLGLGQLVGGLLRSGPPPSEGANCVSEGRTTWAVCRTNNASFFDLSSHTSAITVDCRIDVSCAWILYTNHKIVYPRMWFIQILVMTS